jgi:tetratricopeptide (TPR) repeat protein
VSALSVSIPPQWSALKPDAARQAPAAVALVHVAALIDQSGAGAKAFLAAVPAWLVERNAAISVFFARAQIRSGDFLGAEATLGHALTLDPVSGIAQRELGLLLWRRGATAEAAEAFAAALALQTRLRFITMHRTDIPLLIAQPSANVEIYLYAGIFYVYRRERDAFGARAVAGELFDIQRTMSFRFAYALLRFPMMRRLFIEMWRNSSIFRGEQAPAGPRKWSAIVASGARLRTATRTLLRGIARILFARPILLRAATITQALQISTGLESARSSDGT